MNRKIKAKYNNTLGRFLLRILRKLKYLKSRLLNYIRRLLLPLYLFPIKLLTYSLYYTVRALIKLIVELVKSFLETIIFPFKSFKNLFKSLFILLLILYMVASMIVMTDYIRSEYGWWDKYLCFGNAHSKLKNSVVRVVGGYSEGSGFFIDRLTILTNFHVIHGEPSPKIIFPDGSFATPSKIIGSRSADLALLTLDPPYYGEPLDLMNPVRFYQNEPLVAAGFPFGTDLVGGVTMLDGTFLNFRKSRHDPVEYIQTSINIDKGMSGGPLVDKCGQVVGINTFSLGGTSLYISMDSFFAYKDSFTDQDVTKISLNPSASPEEAVKAFYTYLKARDMRSGYDLLSQEYLKNTNFTEWTNRFKDILDVNVFNTELMPGYTLRVYVKFSTKNWLYNEVYYHYYEGYWDTVFEDKKYKMLYANIEEIANPDYEWFWTSN